MIFAGRLIVWFHLRWIVYNRKAKMICFQKQSRYYLSMTSQLFWWWLHLALKYIFFTSLSCNILWCPNFRRWGFEKLVYRDVVKGIRRDRKYAVQPRNVYATGVHMSQNLAGKTTHKTEGRIKYFHYHGTIAVRREPCRNLINSTEIVFEKTPYVMDTTMRDAAGSVKNFELKMIGSRLQRTRQWQLFFLLQPLYYSLLFLVTLIFFRKGNRLEVVD